MYDTSGKLSKQFQRRFKNLALARIAKEDREQQARAIWAGVMGKNKVVDTDEIEPFTRKFASKKEIEETLAPFEWDWNKLTDPDILVKEWRQKVNLGLLKHGCEFNYKSILKDFLIVRWHMTKLNVPVMDKGEILKLISKTRMYRIIRQGFLNLNKNKVWLVGQKTILNRFNIKDNRVVFLGLPELDNFINTTIEVFAFENQRRYINDLDDFRSECVAAQKTKQRGTSLKLLAKISGVSVSTIQRVKNKSNWIANGYMVDNQNGTFKARDGNLLKRCEHIFVGIYDVIYEVSTGDGYYRSKDYFYKAREARKQSPFIGEEQFQEIINSYLAA